MKPSRRCGRVVEGDGLENRCTARYRGFESLHLRQPALHLQLSEWEPTMIHIRMTLAIIAIISFAILVGSCGGGPPKPGREISLDEHGVTLRLAEGWEGEVIGTDWTMWRRVQRGRGGEPWIIPPITVTNVGAGPRQADERVMKWRFKGVEGVFDQTVSPLTSQYPVPPGLWSLNPQMLDRLETHIRERPGSGVGGGGEGGGVEALCRLYENTHGEGPTATLWHTYTVTFSIESGTYEFVMSIPDTGGPRDWMDAFWTSIEDLTIEAG